jgi:hypothetical protein
VGCPACEPVTGSNSRWEPVGPVIHENVPVITQYASPGLIGPIAYAGHDPGDDPAWSTTGAADHAEYITWCRHLCGMACLQMILAHRDGRAPTLLDLLREGLPHGTYRPEADGRIRGLFYAPFLTYVRAEHGLDGQVHPEFTPNDLRDHLLAGATMAMVSVHKEIRRPERPAPGRGGHLVLVTGYRPATDTLVFHNPSGHTPGTRAAELPVPVFESFYARRGLTLTMT